MNPKIIAFYLPQFHRIHENDEWWGKDFTDWEAVKKAKPLFWGHNQPRIPRNNYYYDLLDKEAMAWQAKIARKAGIYGFCIYHYWFGEKQLLEKPAENLLRWKEININYCFSWANESWIRSWSKLRGNAWVDSNSNIKQNNAGLLIEQRYGDEEEWKKHFLYLLPFFKDKRYIKKDNKPVFVIYKPAEVKRLSKMIDYWNKLARENGLAGIYFVGTNYKNWKKLKLDAVLQYEPGYTQFYEEGFYSAWALKMQKFRAFCSSKNINFPIMLSYKKVGEFILSRRRDINVFPGAFVGFDSSPRKGRNATIFYGATPSKFYQYFSKLYRQCKKERRTFIFLTAWNEWGEGAYLEPDTKYGMGYLNMIRKAVKNNRENEHRIRKE